MSAPTVTPRLLGRAFALEAATVVWNVFEAGAAIAAGVLAASVALTGFGIDSGIEVLSAGLVAARVRALRAGTGTDGRAEQVTLRVIAVTFFALAAYVVADATVTLATERRPGHSPFGLAVTGASLVVMNGLASAKRRSAHHLDATGGPVVAVARLLRADAAESRLCVLLSVATLIGVAANLVFRAWWADPVAALAVVYFALKEGREAWSGELCCDACFDEAPHGAAAVRRPA